ncbi:MAG: hypothetical protein FJY25_06335 [Betaproteobacteria bacterium]|nr:hypothetical protein [Betaproteobacteria bacterium]
MPRTTASPATRRKSRKAAPDASDQAASKAGGSAGRARKPQASSEASKPKRPRRAKAGAVAAADSIEHGFVPKAPPPGAPAAPMLRPADADAASGPLAVGAATVAAQPSAPVAAPVPRHRCSACEYPLPRSARFCRRCGVAQRSAGPTTLVAPTLVADALVADALPAAVPVQPVQAAQPVDVPEPPVTGGSSCGACGMRLPSHAKFCRACGALQLRTAEQVPVPATVEAAAPVEPPPELTTVANMPPRVEPTTEPLEPPAIAVAEDQVAAITAPIPEPPPTQPCRACGEALPLVARFCMFCATLPAVAEPEPEPQVAVAAATEIAHDAEVAAPAEPAEPAEPAAPAAPPDQARADEPLQTSEPPTPPIASPSPVQAEAPPEDRPSLLEPDVIERLEQARNDIDVIGRSLDSLTRTLTPRSPVRPKAPSTRRAH